MIELCGLDFIPYGYNVKVPYYDIINVHNYDKNIITIGENENEELYYHETTGFICKRYNFEIIITNKKLMNIGCIIGIDKYNDGNMRTLTVKEIEFAIQMKLAVLVFTNHII